MAIDFDKYQYEAVGTCMESAFNLDYLIPGLAAEAGEVAGKYAKYIRDEGTMADLHQDVSKELGDVLWFCAVLAEKIGVDLSAIAEANIKKLNSRKNRGVLSGSGDNR